MRGVVEEGVLVKQGKQVQKFWKYNGYAVSVADLERVSGVKLYTPSDGILFATRQKFIEHGIDNIYKDEEQLVLPVQYWESIERRQDG